MQGKTKSGFEYDVDDRILKDWRFTLALTKCQKGEGLEKLQGAQDMIELMLGKKGAEQFIAYIAEQHDGYADSEVVLSEVKEIFESKIPKN